MDDILKKLFESEVLTEDSKKELVEAFQAKLDEAVEKAKEDATTEVRAQLTEQFVAEKELIIEALDTKVEEFLNKNLDELNEDIENFRDLEAEFAERLVEAKQELSETVKKDMAELIDQLDAFNTKCLEEEFAELEESIEEVKKIQFGKEIFEAVQKTFQNNFANADDTLNALSEARAELETTKKTLTESKKALAVAQRQHTLSNVLEPLQGRPREIMEQLLKTVPTDKLNEGYEKFIGRVLHDATSTTAQKESAKAPVLAEGKDELVNADTTTVSGDTQKTVAEDVDADKKSGVITESLLADLKRRAGIE